MKAKRILEKFEEKSDPISDMEIGRNVHRNFKTNDELINWLSNNLSLILGTNSIPSDIISSGIQRVLFPWEYWYEIDNYIQRYITIKGNQTDFNHWDMALRKKLIEIGYNPE